MHAEKIGTPEYFHGMLNKQIDLVERRVIHDEEIPAGEKIHSLFEPHTEWLYKGKSNKWKTVLALFQKVCFRSTLNII